jgi:filamentous hemagglutinin
MEVKLVCGQGDINLLSVPEIRNSNVNTVKKSSWLGLKLNTSTSNATRNQVIQIPAKLTADYIGTKSGYDTRLDGTEFTYLKGANIEAGGTITF